MKNFYPKASCSLLFFCIFFIQSLFAQPVLSYGTPVVTGLNNPVDIVNAGDARLFIVQQNGTIKVWDGTTISTFMDLSAVAGLFPASPGGEQGLLSLAFHPQFAANRYFFIWYTAANGNVTLARYSANAGNLTGDPNSGVVLLSLPKPNQPSYYTNHNGGKLNFGPDGMLYIGTGDGGSGGDPFANAQNGASLLGKMLRLDVNSFATAAPFYNIPPDNPFLVPGDGIADEIYNIGLRNPWRWSFDRANGNMWIADVGQDLYEEVNYRPAGSTAGVNYGWRCREAKHSFNTANCISTYTDPIFEYGHNGTTGGFSITGGYVYRGPDAANAALLGTYVTADYVTGNVWLVKPNGSFTIQTGLPGSVSSFGEAADGTLYVLRRLGSPNGAIYKVTVTSVLAVALKTFTGAAFSGYNTLLWQTVSEINTSKFLLQYSTDNNSFETVGDVPATNNATGSQYSFKHITATGNIAFYRLAIVDVDGSKKYSDIIKIGAKNENKIRIYPTAVNNNIITVALTVPAASLQLINIDGRILYEKSLQGMLGNNNITLPSFAKGTYIIKVNAGEYSSKEKIIIY